MGDFIGLGLFLSGMLIGISVGFSWGWLVGYRERGRELLRPTVPDAGPGGS